MLRKPVTTGRIQRIIVMLGKWCDLKPKYIAGKNYVRPKPKEICMDFVMLNNKK